MSQDQIPNVQSPCQLIGHLESEQEKYGVGSGETKAAHSREKNSDMSQDPHTSACTENDSNAVPRKGSEGAACHFPAVGREKGPLVPHRMAKPGGKGEGKPSELLERLHASRWFTGNEDRKRPKPETTEDQRNAQRRMEEDIENLIARLTRRDREEEKRRRRCIQEHVNQLKSRRQICAIRNLSPIFILTSVSLFASPANIDC